MGISATQGNRLSNGGGACTSREKAAVPILERALGLIRQTKVFPQWPSNGRRNTVLTRPQTQLDRKPGEARRETVYASKPIEFPAEHEIDAREHAPVNRSGLRVTALDPKRNAGLFMLRSMLGPALSE